MNYGTQAPETALSYHTVLQPEPVISAMQMHRTIYNFCGCVFYLCLGLMVAPSQSAAVSPDNAAALAQTLVAEQSGRVVAIAGITVHGELAADAVTALEDRITVQLVSDGGISVVSRSELETILREQSFQLSDLVDEESREEAGRFTGAELLVTGHLFTDRDELDLHLTDVESAEIVATTSSRIPSEVQIPVDNLMQHPGMDRPLRIAVVGIRDASTGTLTEQAAYYERKLETSLVLTLQRLDARHRVVSRIMLDKILRELNFQQSDMAEDQTIASIGLLLGADAVLTGRYDAARNAMTLYLLDVGSARYLAAESADMRRKLFGVPVNPWTIGGVSLAALLLFLYLRFARARRIRRRKIRKNLAIIRKKLKAARSQFKQAKVSAKGQKGLIEDLREVRRLLADLDELGGSFDNAGGASVKKKLQKYWGELGEFETPLYKDMVKIAAGNYTMGTNAGQMDAAPEHQVFVSSFYIDPEPVTNREYQIFVNATDHAAPYCKDDWAQPYNWKDGNYPKEIEDLPVVLVDWDDAAAYARWAGKRLPTEAEWERAGLGKTQNLDYPWGNHFDASQLNAKESNLKRVIKSGTFQPNSMGLYDMCGNVWEWISDWYDKDAYSKHAKSNPKGPAGGGMHCVRGGCWNSNAQLTKIKSRGCMEPNKKHHTIGFRCVKDDYEN
jgi:formylglycine-generating enzyme required for sulfatase activity